jgi:gliding motility-associated-like protein
LKIRHLYLIFLLVLKGFIFGQSSVASTSFIAGKSGGKSFVSKGDIFGTRVFVENRGQFDAKSNEGEKILFAFEHGQERVYFTKTGLIHEMRESIPLKEWEMEAMERGKNVEYPADRVKRVFMNFIGADANSISLEASDMQSHYITYGTAELNSKTFKKLTYRDVYPNIDIEFSIPEDHTHGLKYTVVLRPGADPKHITMLYSGDVDKIKKRKGGEIFIGTALYDLVEHVPETFYAGGETIASEFQLHGDTIGFGFPNGYDANRTVLIDPWVAALTTMTNNNLVYDVDFDFASNLYIFGSYGYAKVAKYSAAGALQWTFSGTVASPSWNSQIGGMTGSVGNFVVDRFTGKSYVGQGANFPAIIRLDVNGSYDNFITATNNSFQELWEMSFGCLSGDVLIVGGGHTSNQSAAMINTTTPVLNLSSFNPANTGFVQDISAFCQDNSGNTYAYYACSNAGLNNHITRVNTTYNGPVWTMPSGFNVYAEINNKSVYSGGSLPSAGYNGLFANNNYLYYYDGASLAAFDKTTGTVVATVVVGNTAKQVGGIAADDCDNLYLGGNGSVLCYHFNGTNFSTLTPISLSLTTTTQRIFDIRLNRSTGTLFLGGSGFAATLPALYSYSCGIAPGTCLFSLPTIAASSTSITCATLGSATVTPNNGIGPFSFTWMPSGQTGSTAINLAQGLHTIVVYDAGYNMTYTTTTMLLPAVPLTATISNSTFLNCAGVNNGTAAIVTLAGGSASQTYTWTNGTATYSTASVSGLGIGNYSLTIRDVLTGCILNKSFSILQPTQLNSFVSASSPTACVGDSILMSPITSGGVPAYTYSWTAGPTTANRTVTEMVPGPHIYTVVSRDQNNCPISAIGTLTFVAWPVISVSSTSICPFKTGTITASGASTYTWNSTTFGPTFTDSPTSNTSYTVMGSALGCSNTASGVISLLPVPSPIISSNSPICNGQNLGLSSNTGQSFVWQGPSSFTSIAVNPIIANAVPSQSGIYNVTVTAANSCTAAAFTSVTINPSPTVTALGGTVCSTQNLSLTANSSSAILFVWASTNGFSSSQQNPVIMTPNANASGIYSLTVFSAQSCSNTAIANVTVTNLPSTFPSNNGPKCELQNLSLSGAATQGGITYAWLGPNGFISNLQNPSLVSVSPFASGVYTLSVGAGPCLTSNTTQVVIHALPSPWVSYNAPVCEKDVLKLQAGAAVTNTIVSYGWSGPMAYTTTAQNPIRVNSQLTYSGVYTVTVKDIFNCVNSTSTLVVIQANPTLVTLSDKVCFKQPAMLAVSGASSYTWTNVYGYVGTTASINILSAQNVSAFIYTVAGTAANSCTGTSTALLETWPLPNVTASVLPKQSGCENSEFIFRAFGAAKYNWDGPANFKAGGQEIRFIAQAAFYSGVYRVIGTDTNGCVNSNTLAIQVFKLPSASLDGGPFSACVPFCGQYQFVQMGGGAAITQAAWVLNKTTKLDKSFLRCFESSGTYSLDGTYTDANGCSNVSHLEISALEKPIAQMKIVPEHPVENEDIVQFTDQSQGQNLSEFTWYLQSLQTHEVKKYNGTQYSVLLKDAGNYVMALVVKNSFGCADTTVKSLVVEEDFLIFVPNAFTPNQDSKNEVFVPVLRGEKKYTLQIFNRWGDLIYEGDQTSSGWDGTYKGEVCKQDVYTWRLNVSAKNGQNKLLTGSVSLYR